MSRENGTDEGPSEKLFEHGNGLKIANFNSSDNFHVRASIEEWMNIPYNSLETVIVDAPDFPKFEFNVKVQNQNKKRDVYIPCCAIARLKKLQEHLKDRKITYSPPNLVKFAFSYTETEHCLKIHEMPKQIRKKVMYREPSDEHIAKCIAFGYHRADDTLVDLSDLDVIYYYLSVLRFVNCSLLNKALNDIRASSSESSRLYPSAVLPAKVPYSSRRAKYYTLYAEVIHFLGLMSPPMWTGDSKSDIVEKVKRRNAEQTKILCDHVGITNYTIVDRGREWFKIVRFFETNPNFCAIMGATIVEAKDEPLITVIEKQTLEQVRTLWKWRKMQDFHNCHTFATNKNTLVHKMAAIAEQCEQVHTQYEKLSKVKGDDYLVPFMSFYMPEKELQTMTNVKGFPELFYAAVSTSVKNKRGNSDWQHFVATRQAKLPREQIERLLSVRVGQVAKSMLEKVLKENMFRDIPEEGPESVSRRKQEETNAGGGASVERDADKSEPRSLLSSTISQEWWSHYSDVDIGTENGGYFQADFNYFKNETTDDGNEGTSSTWDAVGEKKSKDLCYDADVEWDICDPAAENSFPKGTGAFNLESFLKDGVENGEQTTKTVVGETEHQSTGEDHEDDKSAISH